MTEDLAVILQTSNENKLGMLLTPPTIDEHWQVMNASLVMEREKRQQ